MICIERNSILNVPPAYSSLVSAPLIGWRARQATALLAHPLIRPCSLSNALTMSVYLQNTLPLWRYPSKFVKI